MDLNAKIVMLKGERGDSPTMSETPIDNGYKVTISNPDGTSSSFDLHNATSGDYSGLTNKPSINSVLLSGDKTASDLSLASIADLEAFSDRFVVLQKTCDAFIGTQGDGYVNWTVQELAEYGIDATTNNNVILAINTKDTSLTNTKARTVHTVTLSSNVYINADAELTSNRGLEVSLQSGLSTSKQYVVTVVLFKIA